LNIPRIFLACSIELVNSYKLQPECSDIALPAYTANSVTTGLQIVVFRRLWFPQKRSKGPSERQVREMPRPLGPLRPADRRQVLARGRATAGGQPTDGAGRKEPRDPTTTPPPVTLALARTAPVDSILLYSRQTSTRFSHPYHSENPVGYYGSPATKSHWRTDVKISLPG
jgi:hypothetical protein